MQIASLLVVATLIASEALALVDSPAAGGLAVRDHIKRHKKTCKAKKAPSNKGSHIAHKPTGGNSSGGAGSNTGGSSGMSGPKLGLSWTYGNYMNINLFDKNAGWRYNWKESDDTNSDIPYFPMLWNNDGDRVGAWKSKVLNNPSSVKSKTVMAFNEPEISSQANMSPQDACAAFKQYIMPLKRDHGFKVIGPAVVTLEGDWYPNFVKACPDMQKYIDYDAVHLYDTLSQTSVDRLKTWHSKYNRPILITEVACHSFYVTSKAPVCQGAGMANKYYQGLTDFVAQTEWMAGIAPFGVFKSSLPDGVGDFNRLSTPQGTPTSLFKMIASIL